MATGLLSATKNNCLYSSFIFILQTPAVCLAQREFKDQYFDSPTFDLTLRDVWLRKRKGCWELKCPTSAGETEEASGGPSEAAAAALCSRYREITDLPDIQQRVREELCGDGERSASPPADDDDDESWPSGMNLRCFAEFTTVRRSFALEEDGVQVDLDQADFGYSVGEIEVLVPEGGDVQSALEKIGRTAQKLGELSAGEQPKPFEKFKTSVSRVFFYCFFCRKFNNIVFFLPSQVLPVTSELKEK